MEFKPLVQVDPTVMSSNRGPLKNPRVGDYLLNKAPSTECIASKRSLELKKRYLLGETGVVGGIQKSGSTSVLDSKFKLFHSEIPKRLNPISGPTMQTFFKNTKIDDSKLTGDGKENLLNLNNKLTDFSETVNTALVESKIKEMSSIESTVSDRNDRIIDLTRIVIPEKMIVNNQEFIENLEKSEEIIDLTVDCSFEEQNENFPKNEILVVKTEENEDGNKNVINSKEEDKEVEEMEVRPRSPVHETTIQVPTNWEIKSKIESDSLSSNSSSSSSLEDIPHIILDSTTTSPDTQPVAFVPRLEIRDSSGELMQIDSLMIIDGKYVGDPDDLKLMEKLPDGCIIAKQNDVIEKKMKSENCDIIFNKNKPNLDNKKTFFNSKYESFSTRRPELTNRFDTKNANKIESLRNIPLIISPKEPVKLNLNLKECENLIRDDFDDKTPTAEPISINNLSDSENEVTGQGMTETELSDWTADDAVSENFVDIEFALNSNKGLLTFFIYFFKKKTARILKLFEIYNWFNFKTARILILLEI